MSMRTNSLNDGNGQGSLNRAIKIGCEWKCKIQRRDPTEAERERKRLEVVRFKALSKSRRANQQFIKDVLELMQRDFLDKDEGPWFSTSDSTLKNWQFGTAIIFTEATQNGPSKEVDRTLVQDVRTWILNNPMSPEVIEMRDHTVRLEKEAKFPWLYGLGRYLLNPNDGLANQAYDVLKQIWPGPPAPI